MTRKTIIKEAYFDSYHPFPVSDSAMFGGNLSAKPSSGCLPERPPRGPCDHGRAEYINWGAGGGLDPSARVLNTTHTATNRSHSEVCP